jgi:hypothetical protein
MKIIKSQKKKTAHNKYYGAFPGVCQTDIYCPHSTSIGALSVGDVFKHIKIGTGIHSHFILIEDLEEVKFLHEYLKKVLDRFDEQGTN